MSLHEQARKAAIHMTVYGSAQLIDVQCERVRQDDKWGEQNHGDEIWLTVLMEELGEAAQEVLTHRNPEHGNGHGDLRSEVVQIAAVAVAWLEALDRRERDS